MLIDCPKCGNKGLPSVYLPMCTACANIERRKSGDIKDYDASQQSVHLTAFGRRLAWLFFGAFLMAAMVLFIIGVR